MAKVLEEVLLEGLEWIHFEQSHAFEFFNHSLELTGRKTGQCSHERISVKRAQKELMKVEIMCSLFHLSNNLIKVIFSIQVRS